MDKKVFSPANHDTLVMEAPPAYEETGWWRFHGFPT
jgi:hypothetical protein